MKIRKILSFMLCLAMLLAFLPAIAPAASAATPATLYLKPNSNWVVDGARFAAYFFGNGDTWASMTDSNGDGVYEVAVPSGYSKVIFCRMNPSATANNWNNKWNQTGDLTIPTDGKNLFTVPVGAWDGSTATWSTYVYAEAYYTIAGTISAAGWTPASGERLRDLDADGIYTYTYTDVATGEYEYKVTDGSWNASWGNNGGSDNAAVSVSGDSANVTITFDAVNKKPTAKVEYDVEFNGTNVTSNGAATAVQNGTYTASLTAEEGYVLPESITVTVGGAPVTPTWNASTGSLSIANVTGDVAITAVGTEEVVIPDLEFYSASLTVSEGISINFKAEASLFGEGLYTNPTATFVFNKGTENERTFTTDSYTVSGDKYVFQLKNIRPDWMGDTVTATLSAALDGESVTSDPMEYSVATYCYNQLDAMSSQTALSTLLVDILNYGAAAQQYTGYKTGSLVNKDLGEKAVWGTSEAPSLTGAPAIGTGVENAAATWKSVALYLRETTRVRVTFAADSIENVTVTATVSGVTYTLDSIVSAGNGKYYVFFDGLKANQMRQDVVFNVMQGDTAISNTLTCSVVSYAASAAQNGGTLADMLNALINYGDSVIAYAN